MCLIHQLSWNASGGYLHGGLRWENTHRIKNSCMPRGSSVSPIRCMWKVHVSGYGARLLPVEYIDVPAWLEEQ